MRLDETCPKLGITPLQAYLNGYIIRYYSQKHTDFHKDLNPFSAVDYAHNLILHSLWEIIVPISEPRPEPLPSQNPCDEQGRFPGGEGVDMRPKPSVQSSKSGAKRKQEGVEFFDALEAYKKGARVSRPVDFPYGQERTMRSNFAITYEDITSLWTVDWEYDVQKDEI